MGHSESRSTTAEVEPPEVGGGSISMATALKQMEERTEREDKSKADGVRGASEPYGRLLTRRAARVRHCSNAAPPTVLVATSSMPFLLHPLVPISALNAGIAPVSSQEDRCSGRDANPVKVANRRLPLTSLLSVRPAPPSPHLHRRDNALDSAWRRQQQTHQQAQPLLQTAQEIHPPQPHRP